MKILMLVTRVIPSEKGTFIGSHVNNSIQLSKALSKEHQLFIVSGLPQKIMNNQKIIDFPWAKFCPFEINRKMSTSLYAAEFISKSVFKCCSLNKNLSLDIIHGHSGHPYYAWATSIIKGILRIPAIHTIYCPLSDNKGMKKPPFFNTKAIVLSLRYLDKVIAVSRNVANSLHNIGVPKEKIENIPPIIDSKFFNCSYKRNKIRKELGIHQVDSIILFVGNLIKTKGIDILLESIPLVLKKIPNVKFVITLDLALKDSDYEKKRKKELDDKLKLPPFNNHVIQLDIVDDMAGLIAASDIFVAPFFDTIGPSDYPQVILEVMAAGKPVISTMVGGIPEIIKNNITGILIAPKDAQALANSITYLLEQKDKRIEIGINAKIFAASNFSEIHILDRYQQLYKKLSGVNSFKIN